MNLYVMRHAQAEPIGGTVTRDAGRILTARGRDDAALMGRALARLDPNIDAVITSPLTRARQTGEVVAGEISKYAVVSVSDNLSPGFDARSLFDEIITMTADASVLVIGHQPDLGKFIAFLIADSRPAGIAMESGAVAKIQLPPLSREVYLRWLITPECLKGMQH